MASSNTHTGLRSAFMIVLGVLALAAGPAQANLLLVDIDHPDCDDTSGEPVYCNLGPAVEAAMVGDTIELAAGVYGGPANRDIEPTGSLTIRGAGMHETILDAELAGFHLRIHNYDELTDLILQDLGLVRGQTASDEGAAVDLALVGSLIIERVRFADTVNGTLSVLPTAVPPDAPMRITDSFFENNQAQIFNVFVSQLEVRNVRFENNQSQDHAGALMGSMLEIVDSQFIGNTGHRGGAAALDGSIIRGSLFENNSAVEGGALTRSSPLPLEIETSLFVGNSATDGGAIHSVVDSTPPPPMPGAPDPRGSLVVHESSMVDNTATGDGGVAYHVELSTGYYLPFVMENVTMSGNQAERGGAIALAGAETTMELRFATLADNSATEGSALYLATESANSNIRHSVLTGQSVCAIDADQPPASGGYNVVTDNSCLALLDASTDQHDTDPLLGPLADNGGPTLTHLPGDNSPLINSGGSDCPPTDQRGIPRPQGSACDRGAVEVEGEAGGGPEALAIPTLGPLALLVLALGMLLLVRHIRTP